MNQAISNLFDELQPLVDDKLSLQIIQGCDIDGLLVLTDIDTCYEIAIIITKDNKVQVEVDEKPTPCKNLQQAKELFLQLIK